MEIWIGVTNAAVVMAVGLIVTWLGKGKFEGLEMRFDRLEERNDKEHAALRASIESLRSDLTAVALAVGVPRGPRRLS